MGFLSRSSVYSTLILASFLGIAALGQTVVVLLGGIDLSVPALITGANLVSAMLSGRHWPFALVIAFTESNEDGRSAVPQPQTASP